MRYALFAAVGAALLTGAGLALAQPAATAPTPPPPGGMMERADANHDGVVTRAEFDASVQARFNAMDTNHDGTLSEAERQAGRAAMRDGHGPGGPGGPGRPPMMRDPDANHDGVITREEFLAGPTSMFERLDANHDGRLTGDEMPPRMERHSQMMRRGGEGALHGNVTLAEYQARAARMFDRMDVNHDGQLSQADRDAMRRGG